MNLRFYTTMDGKRSAVLKNSEGANLASIDNLTYEQALQVRRFFDALQPEVQGHDLQAVRAAQAPVASIRPPIKIKPHNFVSGEFEYTKRDGVTSISAHEFDRDRAVRENESRLLRLALKRAAISIVECKS